MTGRRKKVSLARTATITGDLDGFAALMERELGNSGDLRLRRFRIARGPRALLVYIETVTEEEVGTDRGLKPLQHRGLRGETGPVLSVLEESVLPVAQVTRVTLARDAVRRVLEGTLILVVEGSREALVLHLPKPPLRQVEEPKTEQTIRGPRDGFTESISVGIGLVRRRIRDPRLRVEEFRLGAVSRSRASLLYLDGVAAPDLVRMVRDRLRRIRTDAVLESGYVEQFIEGHPFSPFPQMLHTERPDRVVGAILEGRVAILVDGTPFALVLPVTAGLFLQSPEDYYERVPLASFPRFIRALVVIITGILPALYVVFTAYHVEILPADLMLTIATGQARLPFPSVVEALLMELFIEFLLEASVRLPAAIGPAVGIVGALIIGESAVRAGLVGPTMVIIIALTAIASYSVPSYVISFSMKLIRLSILAAASVLGLLGLMFAVNLLVVHIVALESFGTPYLSPIAPANIPDMRDHLLRWPLWSMRRRPDQFRGRGRRQPDRVSYLQEQVGPGVDDGE